MLEKQGITGQQKQTNRQWKAWQEQVQLVKLAMKEILTLGAIRRCG